MNIKKDIFTTIIAIIFLITIFVFLSYFFALTLKYVVTGNLLAILIFVVILSGAFQILSKKYTISKSKVKYTLIPLISLLVSYGLEKYFLYFSYSIFLFSLTYLSVDTLKNNPSTVGFLEKIESFFRTSSSFEIITLPDIEMPILVKKNKLTYSIYLVFRFEHFRNSNELKEIISMFSTKMNFAVYALSLSLNDGIDSIGYLILSIKDIIYRKILDKVSEFLFPVLNAVNSEESTVLFTVDEIDEIQALVPYLFALFEKRESNSYLSISFDPSDTVEHGLGFVLIPNNKLTKELIANKKQILKQIRQLFGGNISDYALWAILLKSSDEEFPELAEYKASIEKIRKLEREGVWDFRLFSFERIVDRNTIWANFPEFCMGESCRILVKEIMRGTKKSLSSCLNMFFVRTKKYSLA